MNQHDARDDVQAAQLCQLPWRIGRRVGRNLYAQLGPEPGDHDVAIGQLDSALLAAEAVLAHNYRLRQDDIAE